MRSAGLRQEVAALSFLIGLSRPTISAGVEVTPVQLWVFFEHGYCLAAAVPWGRLLRRG